MVLSLVDLSLVAVRDGLENGSIQDVSGLPSDLRQELLDMVLMHGTINRAGCLNALGCPEFLSGFTSFNTQQGRIEDSKYLKRVSEAMSTKLPDGTTLGSQFTNVKLNLYQCSKGHDGESHNFQYAVALIAQCHNLRSVDFNFVSLWGDISDCIEDCNGRYQTDDNATNVPTNIFSRHGMARIGLLNIYGSEEYQNIMQNLRSLIVNNSYDADILCSDSPILQFKQLTSLHLSAVDIRFDEDHWFEFLERCKDTLESLSLTNVGKCFTHQALPFPMPCLKSLEMFELCKIDQAFISNLNACPHLEHVLFDFFVHGDGDPSWTSLLRSIQTNANVQIKFHVYMDLGGSGTRFGDPPVAYEMFLDLSSRFKVVQAVGQHITKLDVMVSQWDHRLIPALTHAIEVCQNLESLCFNKVNIDDPRISTALIKLFRDPERASKIRELKLHGDFETNLIECIFMNCLKLETLDMWRCSQIHDLDLINWIQRHPKPLRSLAVKSLENVHGDGLIAVIVNSGKHLKNFSCDKSMNRIWYALAENCQLCEPINGVHNCDDSVKDMVKSKAWVFVSRLFMYAPSVL